MRAGGLAEEGAFRGVSHPATSSSRVGSRAMTVSRTAVSTTGASWFTSSLVVAHLATYVSVDSGSSESLPADS